MEKETNPMEKFDFLLGAWELKYDVPKSQFSDKLTGEGRGEFKRILNDRYVTFDYEARFSKGEASAHAVFVWDKKDNNYKYWWFEDSGEFNQATCDFIDKNTLCLNWHNSLFVQSFHKSKNGDVILEMRYPKDRNDYKIVLKVIFMKVK
jgi:hypothetical protein